MRRAWRIWTPRSRRSRAQLAAGFTSICIKPSQFTDDPAAVRALCRAVVDRVAAMEVV